MQDFQKPKWKIILRAFLLHIVLVYAIMFLVLFIANFILIHNHWKKTENYQLGLAIFQIVVVLGLVVNIVIFLVKTIKVLTRKKVSIEK
jgi:TRAP-type C4-dicarboxylate transport system permease small subunit